MGWLGNALKSVGSATADGITGGLASGISGAIGGLFGGIGAKKRMKRQVDAQKQLNEQAAKLNYEYGEKAAKNAYRRQMEMYERSYQDQSYAAMRKQMEDAGLSIGLMYGGGGNGGAGGATTGAPQGETGGAEAGRADSPAAQQAAAIQQAQMGLGLVSMKKDLAIKDAQVEEINATAAAKRAEAGLSTQKTITEMQTRDPLIKKLNAEVGNIKAGTAKMNAERELINTENSIRKVELDVKKATKESVIQTAYHGALKAHQEFLAAIENVRGMKADNEVKERSIDTLVATYEAKLRNIQVDTLLKRSEGLLNAQEAEKVYAEAYRIFLQNKRWKLDTLLDVLNTNIDIERLNLEQKKLVVDSVVKILAGFVGGKAIGTGMRAKNAEQHGKVPTVYDSNGKPISWESW